MKDTFHELTFESAVADSQREEGFAESSRKKPAIVVGIDYSSCGDNAARVAAHMSKIYEARVACLHVFERRIMKDLGSSIDAIGKIGRAAQEYFVSHVRGILSDVEVAPKVVLGEPLDEILREVDQQKPQILVLG